MNSRNPTQFTLVEHKGTCRFCWLEKREFVRKLSVVSQVDERGIERVISTWIRHNGPKLPLGLIYGAFALASNLFLLKNSLLFSIALGVGTAIFVTFIRVLVLWIFYRSDGEAQQATLVQISQNTHTDIALVAKWINDSITELFLWRQFPRGFSLVVSSIYAAITLDFLIAGAMGFLLWLAFGVVRYAIWDWGHYKIDTIDFARHGAARAELRPVWVDFFHLSYFIFTAATLRWAIGFICLLIVLFRLGNIVEPGQPVSGYNWYFYFLAANFLVSLRNDVV